MKTNIVRIGNSQGIRIPKPVLKQCNLSGQVELLVKNGQLVVINSTGTRNNWSQKFESGVNDRMENNLLGDHSLSKWENEEWQW